MDKISKIAKAYDILKDYNGMNTYIKYLQTMVYVERRVQMNDFHTDFVLRNFDKPVRSINKIVKISDWWGLRMQAQWQTEFVPEKIKITDYLGDTEKCFVFYAWYRRSQRVPVLCFAPKEAIITDFLAADYNALQIDFAPYNTRSGRKLMPYQEEAVKFLVSQKKGILASEMGSGKCQNVNTVIPTPIGYRRMGDLKVGDCVWGSDGKSHNIIGVFPQGEKAMYELTFSDGQKTNCGEEHLWITREKGQTEWQNLMLGEMMKKDAVWEIPVAKATETTEKGGSVQDIDNIANMCCSYYQLRVSLPGSEFVNSVSKEYFASLPKADKQTFIDKIVSISKKNDDGSYRCLGFHRNYAEIMLETILSMGGTGSVGFWGFKNFALWVDLRFTLPKDGKPLLRTIKKIKRIRKAQAVCIKVDSDDESYLTEHYIVTHNTMAAIVASIEDKYEHILVIAPASVKKTWEKELGLLVPPEDITIVNGKDWKDAKYTIINYDVLKNFYELPTKTVVKKELNVDDDGNIIVEKKTKERITSQKDVVAKAMEGSTLFQSHFDLVIIDEAHKLSNTTSGRFKIVNDFLKRTKPKGIYELTGTPITNRPINFFNLLKIIDAPIANDWTNYVKRYCDGKQFYKKGERMAYTTIFLRQHGKRQWADLSYNEKRELDAYLESKCGKIWAMNGASNLDELQERIKSCYLRRLKSDFGNVVKKTVKLLQYPLTPQQRNDYNLIWDDYTAKIKDAKALKTATKFKQITEGSILRQWLAKEMIGKTIELGEKLLKTNDKIVIFCSYDIEIERFKEHFGDMAVVHNGKKTIKQKDTAVNEFQNNDNVRVFIGNITSAGVGLTLVKGTALIFNSFSWVSGDNLQSEDRIHRLNQTKDVVIYYQTFADTFFVKMFNEVRGKQEIIDNIIIPEKEK